jgi:hypothetical protein
VGAGWHPRHEARDEGGHRAAEEARLSGEDEAAEEDEGGGAAATGVDVVPAEVLHPAHQTPPDGGERFRIAPE